MITLMRDGGFPMFFLLAFGLAALVLSVRFALSPSQRMLKTALAMSCATAFAAFTGICTAFAAVGQKAPVFLKRHPDPDTTLAEVVLIGFGESMSPGILGGVMLSLIAIILALGLWRQNPA
jgi:hypothetical protein